jgi:hypothetical protein
MDQRGPATKVVIENRILRGSKDDMFLQRVATVYVDGDEFRVLAPPKATGDALEWLRHLSVRKPEGFGSEIVVTGAYSVFVVKVVKQELEKLKGVATTQESAAPLRTTAAETPKPTRVAPPYAVPAPPTRQSTKVPATQQGWSRGEKITILSLVIAVLALVAAWLVVPEFRHLLHLDKASTPTSMSAPGRQAIGGTAASTSDAATAVANPLTPNPEPSRSMDAERARPTQSRSSAKKAASERASSEPASQSSAQQASRTVPPGTVLPSNSVISIGEQGGITAGQVNIGSVPWPLPTIKWTTTELAKDTTNPFPGLKIVISMDRSFTNAAFTALCDRPCNSIKAVASQGFTDSVGGFNNSNPNLVVIRIDLPRIVQPTDSVEWEVRSKDDQPVRVSKVEPLRSE